MKKLSLALALVATTLTAQAQKGSWYIGGNAGFNSTSVTLEDKNGNSVDDVKQTSWTIAPEVGTFLTDDLSLGLGLNFGGAKADARNAAKDVEKTSLFGGTLYSRYFFGSGSFRPFMGVNVSYNAGKETLSNISAETENKLSIFGANLNAGFAYAMSPCVTVVGSFGTLGFQNSVTENETSGAKVKENSFGLDAGTLGNRFTIGVYYTFKH